MSTPAFCVSFMPKRRVEYDRLAERDIEQVFRWYSAQNPRAAARFLEQLRDTVSRIAADAEFFPVLSRGVRWAKLEDFRYVVNFLILDDQVCRIYSVSHTSRRPGHWYRRLPKE